MPPLEGFWNYGKQFVQSWTGTGDKSGERAHDSAEDDPACDNPDIEEISEPNTKKRKVVAGVTISRKRPDTRSKHERRLQGDYDVPSDAVPLVMPGSFHGTAEDFGASTRMSRSKPGAGGGAFKPLNTLGRDRLHGGRGRASPDTPRPGARVAGKRKGEDDPIVTYQRPAGNGRNGDGLDRVDLGAQQRAKRQKIQHAQHRDLAYDPIDDEGDGDGEITSLRRLPKKSAGKTAHNSRTQAMVGSSWTAPFEGNEALNVDKLLRTVQHKSRRKQANGYASSQDSSRPPSSLAVKGQSSKSVKPAPEIVNLIDDDTSQEISQHHATQAPLDSSQELPDVKLLARGVQHDTDRTRRRRQSENSVEWSHTNAKSKLPASGVNGGARTTHRQTSPPGRRSIKQDDDYRRDKESRTKEQAQLGERRLKDTFVRDDSGSEQRVNVTNKRKDAMKIDSGRTRINGGSTRDSLGSMDELCGEKTVGSVSPEKQPAQVARAGLKSKDAQASRPSSPSDLRPSQFTATKTAAGSRRTTSATQDMRKDETDERNVIPLQDFCSTSYFVLGGGIALEYHPRTKQLTVHPRDIPAVSSGRKDGAEITHTEASQVFFNRESNVVYLKGSAGKISNGQICLVLDDPKDISWFLGRLRDACRYPPTVTERRREEMSNIYRNQVKLIENAQRTPKPAAERLQELSDKIDAKQSCKEPSSDGAAMDHESIQRGVQKPPYRRNDTMGNDVTTDPGLESRVSLPKILKRSHYFNDTPRRSTRQSKPVKRSSSPPETFRPKWTQINKPERWPHSVVYPNEGARRVTVDFQDLERLDDGEFLNDNVISFALRQIEENMAPEHKKRVHFFNSFFYSALTTKNGKKAFNYDAVKRWTKGKDLFGYDYIVVPINIDLHWFLAIICNLPNLPRRPAGLDEEEVKLEGENETGEKGDRLSSDPADPSGAAEVEQVADETSETKGMRHLSLSDYEAVSKVNHSEEVRGSTPAQGTQESEDAKHKQKRATSAGRKGKKRGPPSYPVDKPAIITLDSFGTSHGAEIRNLKEYIAAEAEERRGMAVELIQLQGANVRGIPTQNNFYDCGLYLVGYVEQFAKDPLAFVSKALDRDLGKAGEFDDFDADRMRGEIREELLKLQKEQEAEHKAKKASKKAAAGKKDEQSGASAAPSPKPESKPTSKSASPARDTSKAKSVSAVQQRQRGAAATWSPAEKAETKTHPQDGQEDELEYEPPRAYQHQPQQEKANPQSAQLTQSDGTSEEMLDDPRAGERSDQALEENNTNPHFLLDGLAEAVRRNSQQAEHSDHQAQRQFDDELREAAAQVSPSPVQDQDDSGDEDDDGPDVVRHQDVIDLGDEEDEVERAAEIPDSQSQGKRAGTPWAGHRKVFDD